MQVDWTIVATFAAYLLAVLILGGIAYWRTASLADYILGGRRLGAWVTALSAQASDMSGWLLLGLPGLAYMAGLGAIWLPLGLAVGTWLNWQLIAPRLRRQSEALGNALTLPDYLEARFNDHWRLLRIVAAIVVLVFFTIYTASGLKAGGMLFVQVFNLDYLTAVVIGGLAILLYTALGGFLAVSWTDTLQGMLMFLTLVTTALLGVWMLGGLNQTHATLQAQNPQLTNVWTGRSGQTMGVIGIVSLLGWGLGYFGQPHILARFMAIRQPGHMNRAMTIALVWVVVCLTAAVAVGMLGNGLLESALTTQKQAETVFMKLVETLFHPVIAGICLAGILAAVMSTADSQLLVASSAVAEDFYKALLRPDASQKELVWLGRAAVVAVALVALIIASDKQSSVLGLVGYAWAGFGAAFGPTMLVSLLWQRMNRAAALVGMLVGGSVVVLWRHLAGLVTQIAGALEAIGLVHTPGQSTITLPAPFGIPIFELYALVPGFILSLGSILIVTALTTAAPPREPTTQ